MSRRTRGLRPEEEEIWAAVARSARRLHPGPRAGSAKLPPALSPSAPPDPAPAPAAAPFAIGARRQATATVSLDLAPHPADPARPPAMDARAFGRMMRGKLAPEARIDLHGMTLAEAHPELVAFILGAAARGLRLVLVITGKGRGGREGGHGMGVLKRQVPAWLRAAPLGPLVLELREAHLRHGGAGAYYVYLRRDRAPTRG